METTSVLIFGAIEGVWSFLVYLVFGLIAAGIAKAITPGKDPGGFIISSIIGIVGAYLGHSMRAWLGLDTDNELNFLSISDWIFTVGGALILLFVWKLISKMFSRS
ncbi:GlsB/YeaQ/YmgE family stress response membrane protein [Moheibacter lacus]|uniref:GlsB/YeaQ/YmgE family stress response membrane protein n=1 Tax=Moheibacter lacus TaxID=2745851 RepID=A0A838ZIY2_9FLAO|nr:GlsB/YeaQ/YmgE family stress response membrane protein [Moheibacter lacus]MBA5628314.1 GlsB/YeaQ/YmgE family stress response membrane protein [Moheibacter lacus]